jgi:hypothetical protein
LYTDSGSTQTIYIKITEGDGSRWTIYKSIDINLVPKSEGTEPVDCDETPEDESCKEASGSKSDSGSNMMLIGVAVGAVVLLIVVIVTMMLVRGRGGEESTTGGIADVADMDPVEAYVQQLVAQGYPEETARAYAQQYYAQAAQQQQQAGGGGYA